MKIIRGSREEQDVEKILKNLENVNGLEIEEQDDFWAVKGTKGIYVGGCDEVDIKARFYEDRVEVEISDEVENPTDSARWDYGALMSQVENKYPKHL